ncbi:PREDICTED: B-cell CLL/lymphoma 6 member B protein-like [Vollenhovia emeryi]|uniref:B-cell CLL/lymphoma 6 member B protein-like n=1 Tax=Vollenhovia emeryi TaxID=411798 RepID=UPI0005F47A4C|nr:PREDICTED: B-cell CLL/lymphoma 6 member B protein-like [Vollenhovia emeryi]
MFACPNPNCRSVFKWKKNLQFHIRHYCTLKPRFKCPYCEYIVKYKADIRKHILARHKNRYVYAIDTSQQKVVDVYLALEFQERLAAGTNCNKNVRTYRRNKEGTYSEVFPCLNPNCGSVFTLKRNLQTHIRYQCGREPKYKCPYCDYVVKYKSNIRAHIPKKHEDRFVYVIDISEQKVID